MNRIDRVTSVTCSNPEAFMARLTDELSGRQVIVYDCDSTLGETHNSLKNREPKLVFVLNASSSGNTPSCVKEAILFGRHWNMAVYVLNGEFAEPYIRENVDDEVVDELRGGA